MSYQQGASTRLQYDDCAYAQELRDSTSPYTYQMFEGKFENCNKCIYDKFYTRYDGDVIDAESELKNITRSYSKCEGKKYNPGCEKSKNCTSTFDKSVPVVYAHEVCPIVYNNLNWKGGNGYMRADQTHCTRRN